jgi:hypothetical protein
MNKMPFIKVNNNIIVNLDHVFHVELKDKDIYYHYTLSSRPPIPGKNVMDISHYDSPEQAAAIFEMICEAICIKCKS